MSAEKEGQPSTAAKYESIVVTLTQANPPADSPFPVRNIRLSAQHSSAKVGRSSKTVSKGLAPSADNAFFDSPVMSRTHAEFLADLDTGNVRLKDTASLHGVFVNMKALEKNGSIVLRSGDDISFGIHVARGLEVFRPTKVKVGIVSHEAEPTAGQPRAYRAPEPSDDVSDMESEYASSAVDSVHPGNAEDLDDAATTENPSHESSESDEDSVRIILPNHKPAPSVKSYSLSDLDSSSDDDSDYGEVESVSDGGYPITSLLNSGDEEEGSNKDEEVMEGKDSDEAVSDHGDDDAADKVDQTNADPDKTIDVEKMDVKDCFGDGSDFLMTEIGRLRSLPTWPKLSISDMVEDELRGAAPPEDVLPEATLPEAEAPKENAVTPPMEEPKEAEGVKANTGKEMPDDFIKVTDLIPGWATASSEAATKKFNISSILNPSPPPSSPLQDDSSTHADPGAVVDLMAPCREAFNQAVYAQNNVVEVQPTMEVENTVASAVPRKSSDAEATEVHDPPTAAERLVDDGTTLGYGNHMDISLFDSSEIFACPAQDDYLGMDIENELEDDDEYEADMVSAAVFHSRKMGDGKKRKADDMLKDSAEAAEAAKATMAANAYAASAVASPSVTAGVPKEKTTHPSDSTTDMSTDAVPSKRQATETSMRAGRMARGAAWAFAEKVGIAALGGAVVLGSLIYTAPAL